MTARHVCPGSRQPARAKYCYGLQSVRHPVCPECGRDYSHLDPRGPSPYLDGVPRHYVTVEDTEGTAPAPKTCRCGHLDSEHISRRVTTWGIDPRGIPTVTAYTRDAFCPVEGCDCEREDPVDASC